MISDIGAHFVSLAQEISRTVISPYYRLPEHECRYPLEILDRLAQGGFLGMNIPERFGGLRLPAQVIPAVIKELSREALSIPAILSSHMRAATYVVNCGTTKQKEEILPKMARGEVIAAHAQSERHLVSASEMNTTIHRDGERSLLSGEKHWVTNALECDLLVVLARDDESEALRAIMIPRDRFKEITMKDLARPGVKGCSLCEVSIRDYELDPSNDLVGGYRGNVASSISSSGPGKYLNFAARAVACSETIVAEAINAVHVIGAAAHPVALHRLGEASAELYAAQSTLAATLHGVSEKRPSPTDCISTRIACTRAMSRIIDLCANLLGGSGYAGGSSTVERITRDASSLLASGNPIDRLSTQLATIITEELYE